MNFLLIMLFTRTEYPEFFNSSGGCTMRYLHGSRRTRIYMGDILCSSTSRFKTAFSTDLSLMGQLNLFFLVYNGKDPGSEMYDFSMRLKCPCVHSYEYVFFSSSLLCYQDRERLICHISSCFWTSESSL